LYATIALMANGVIARWACLCAALLRGWLAGGDTNVRVQVGLVMLMGLACKNAILIVEFARGLEIHGRETVDATLEARGLRMRAIVMASVAFIAGAVSLLISYGAGGEVRTATGVTAAAGMLGSEAVRAIPDAALLRRDPQARG
jgi:multidrug efflux pump